MTKKQQQCPYCHHETGGKHCVLLEYTYLTMPDWIFVAAFLVLLGILILYMGSL